MLIRTQQLVTVKIYYYVPDYQSILNQYVWQTSDYWPEIPRIHKLLNYWHKNIDAVINEVLVQSNTGKWRAIDNLVTTQKN